VGKEIGPRLRSLFDADTDQILSRQIRQAYARLGSIVTERIERLHVCKALELKEADLAGHVLELARVKADLAGHAAELPRLQADVAAHVAELLRLQADVAAHVAELTRVKADLAAHVTERARLQADLTAERDHAAHLSAAAAAAALQGEKLEADLEAIKHSFSWRITGPLRLAAKAFGSLRRMPVSGRVGPRQRRSGESARDND
jgi:chromosome segregation ATPase